jgi:penicillin-binding protein 1C
MNKIKELIQKQGVLVGLCAFLGAAVLFCIVFYFFVLKDLPPASTLKNQKIVPASTLMYDRNGKLLYQIYRDQNRTPIKVRALKPYIYQASIAIEDKDFYKHGGIDVVSGILRAIKDSLLRQNLQGGSTITQQLVKNALLSPERTVQRKIREMILAIQVEQQFTKQEILEMYLNQVAYGGSAYGVEEAAKTFFGKHAQDLDISEAAFLAGLPQAPSLYSPFLNPALALKRRNEVLNAMKQQGYISASQLTHALAEKMTIIPLKTIMNAPHFVFYIKQLLEQQYGADVVEQGGLKVTTTLDLDIQQQAEQIVKDEVAKVDYLDVGNGAALITRPPTGEILAMVGSADYYATASGTFNVTTALRQPGSSIKPLNYAIGIDRKLVTAGTMFLDIPTCFTAEGQPGSYCPVNYDGKFHGPTQLRFALGNSFNIPAVKMLALNGVANFIASASAFTITSFNDPSRYGLSLTLGGGEVRMTEMAQNQGVPRKLNGILKVEDRFGKVLYEFKDPNLVKDVKKPLQAPSYLAIPGKKVISGDTSYIISHILLDNNARVTEFGDNSYLVVSGKAVSVKTGTTDDKKDNWTIGYTPNFLTAVWVGNNDNTPMNPALASGLTGAAPIWNHIMRTILKDQPDLWPVKPETVVGVQICNDSGALMVKDDGGKESCSARYEYFIKGTEPKPLGSMTQSVPINKDTNKLASPTDTNVENQNKTILQDMFSNYCVDCNHDNDPFAIVKL